MIRMGTRWIIALAIGIFVCSNATAQERVIKSSAADKYVISAKAGGVNYTEGAVTVSRLNGRGGILLKDDQLEIGDRVSIGANGRVEVLLNPGSYLRLGANSEFEFKTTLLDDLQIQLYKGSAMFEVFATDEFRVSVFTPKGKATLIESGVYRVDLSADGSGTIAVTEGKAEVGISSKTMVKRGRTATIGTQTVAITKFDRDKRDELAEWSRSRAKDMAKMTSSLKNRDVRDSLISSFHMGRWGMFDSFGLWVFNPFARAYCFLPFGYGWYSPYGYGFGTGIYWYNLPPVIYFPPTAAANPNNGIKTPRRAAIDVEPPYTKIERTREPVRTIRGSDFPTDTSRPVRVYEPPPMPVYVPAPAPAPTGKKPRDD